MAQVRRPVVAPLPFSAQVLGVIEQRSPNTNYDFTYVAGTLTINRAPQSITFATPPKNRVVGDSFIVSATGGASGNPVVFSIDPHTTNAACALRADGRTIKFQHAGNCVIDAGQAGNNNYRPAALASETLAVVDADAIYWADFECGAIRAQSPGGAVATLYRAEQNPSGVAVDPAAGKIYWTDTGAGTIRVGNLDRSGRPQTPFSHEGTPLGVAIDPAQRQDLLDRLQRKPR